jgi:hypothetical protein
MYVRVYICINNVLKSLSISHILLTKLLIFFAFVLCFASEDAYRIACELHTVKDFSAPCYLE